MIVLDASVLVELVLATPTGQTVATRVGDPATALHIPHLADVEVAQALRRLTIAGFITAEEATLAVDGLQNLDLQRHSHEPLLGRVWQLRNNLSAYDAVYVALAEALETKVLTCDGRLANAPGIARRIEFVAS